MHKALLILVLIIITALPTSAVRAEQFGVGYAVCHNPDFTRCEVNNTPGLERLLSWEDFVFYQTGITNTEVINITYDSGAVVIYFKIIEEDINDE